jgi:hypothetical protein
VLLQITTKTIPVIALTKVLTPVIVNKHEANNKVDQLLIAVANNWSWLLLFADNWN